MVGVHTVLVDSDYFTHFNDMNLVFSLLGPLGISKHNYAHPIQVGTIRQVADVPTRTKQLFLIASLRFALVCCSRFKIKKTFIYSRGKCFFILTAALSSNAKKRTTIRNEAPTLNTQYTILNAQIHETQDTQNIKTQ